ncbi:MAG: hypothetical protein IPJ01_11040 [Micavibrio sp.]|nr:hypothetical protein [Micavibrio sp.]
MAITKQIAIDVTSQKASVYDLNNGLPVFPVKNLNLTTLNPTDKAKVDEAILIIQTHATT